MNRMVDVRPYGKNLQKLCEDMLDKKAAKDYGSHCDRASNANSSICFQIPR
jgi:hypothetical protein